MIFLKSLKGNGGGFFKALNLKSIDVAVIYA